MKFNYRGVHYNADPSTLPIVEDEIIGKYRGADNHVHHSVPVPENRTRRGYTLKYRGVQV